MNIFKKMKEATEKISRVAKNLEVGFGRNMYKAVGEADVLDAVKPIEAELGIYSYPYDREVIYQDMVTVNSGEKERVNAFFRIKVVYRFVNIDNPEEYIDIVSYGDGVDSQDKAPGKAMTYADKYALLKAYKIETGDDPDKDPSGKMKKPLEKLASETQINRIKELVSEDKFPIMFKTYKVSGFADLTEKQAADIIRKKERK